MFRIAIDLRPDVANKNSDQFSRRLSTWACFFRPLFLYVCFAGMMDFNASFRSPLRSNAEPAEFVSSKAHQTAPRFTEDRLALNFLANTKKLSFGESKAFQSTGLMHLLAISGAQTSVVVGFLSFFSSLLYITLRPSRHHAVSLFRAVSLLRAVQGILLSLGIAALFGNTGSLLRVGFLRYVQAFPHLRLLGIHLSRQFLPETEYAQLRMMLLTCYFLAFGNPFSNRSFLLSALGAAVASLCGNMVGSNLFSEDNALALSVKELNRGLFASALTTSLMGILLMPFFPADLFSSVAANFLAGPLTNFFISPLSLLLLLLPATFPCYDFLLSSLDFCLALLSRFAKMFSQENTIHNPFESNGLLNSKWGEIYLVTLLIILWAQDDFRRGKARRMVNNLIYIGKNNAS